MNQRVPRLYLFLDLVGLAAVVAVLGLAQACGPVEEGEELLDEEQVNVVQIERHGSFNDNGIGSNGIGSNGISSNGWGSQPGNGVNQPVNGFGLNQPPNGVASNGSPLPNGLNLTNGSQPGNGINLTNGPQGSNGITLAALTISPRAGTDFQIWYDAEPGNNKRILKYMVQCALPLNKTVKFIYGGVTESWQGMMGLGTSLLNNSFLTNTAHQRAVSACLLARVNAMGEVITIDLHGNFTNAGLNTMTVEDEPYTKAEMAFYGNLFANPPEAFYCNTAFPTCGSRACKLNENASDCGCSLLKKGLSAKLPAQGSSQCSAVCANSKTLTSNGKSHTYYWNCKDDQDNVYTPVITTFVKPVTLVSTKNGDWSHVQGDEHFSYLARSRTTGTYELMSWDGAYARWGKNKNSSYAYNVKGWMRSSINSTNTIWWDPVIRWTAPFAASVRVLAQANRWYQIQGSENLTFLVSHVRAGVATSLLSGSIGPNDGLTPLYTPRGDRAMTLFVQAGDFIECRMEDPTNVGEDRGDCQLIVEFTP